MSQNPEAFLSSTSELLVMNFVDIKILKILYKNFIPNLIFFILRKAIMVMMAQLY